MCVCDWVEERRCGAEEGREGGWGGEEKKELLFLLRRAEFLHAANLVQQLRHKVLREEKRDKQKWRTATTEHGIYIMTSLALLCGAKWNRPYVIDKVHSVLPKCIDVDKIN